MKNEDSTNRCYELPVNECVCVRERESRLKIIIENWQSYYVAFLHFVCFTVFILVCFSSDEMERKLPPPPPITTPTTTTEI